MSGGDVTDRPGEEMERALATAVRAVQGLPDSEAGWSHLEELCEQMQRPAEAAGAYCAALSQALEEKVREELTQRALSYHEEWFGDDPEMMTRLLSRIIECQPDAQWAFSRLTRVLTVAEQWENLLDVYDRALANEQQTDRRKRLLSEAAHAAKDLAGEPGRAIDYMQQQLELERGNAQLMAGLERLLERAGRWEDLLVLWQDQIASVAAELARELRLRMARLSLSRLLDPARALAALRDLLDESPGHAEGCTELEGILALSTADAEVRFEAFTLLRANYDAAGERALAVAAVEQAIAIVEGERRRVLRRDAGQRLAILERDAEAMTHYRELLVEEPADTDARRQLRRLSSRSSQHGLRAEALVAAADNSSDATMRASLLSEAAGVQRDELGAPEVAIELFTRVLDDPALAAHEAVGVGHDLAQLLRDAGREQETLSVLERLATLEASVSAKRLVLAEAAQLAEHLGEIDRAVEAWRARLALEPEDREALDALIAVLDRAERWGDLLASLKQRCNNPGTRAQLRADLVRIAKLHVDAREDSDAGIEAWLEVVRHFGVDAESLSALDALMSKRERYEELSELLKEATASERPTAVRRLSRLGDIYSQRLERELDALRAYLDALELDPTDEAVRSGLTALLEHERTSAPAAEALASAHRKCGEFAQLVGLLEVRLRGIEAAAERARVLCEAAELHEQHLGAPDTALSLLARALPEDPGNGFVEAWLRRLCQGTGQHQELAAAYGAAASAASDRPRIAARLHYAQGGVLEHHMELSQAALGAYEAASTHLSAVMAAEPSLPTEPSETEVLRGLTRCAARCGDWERAADALLGLTGSRDELEIVLWESVEQAAAEQEALVTLCAAIESSFGAHATALSPHISYEVELRLAALYRDGCSELEAAERTLIRAIARRPDARPARDQLAELQRRTKSPELVETLLSLDALDAALSASGSGRNLDALLEAVQLSESVASPERSLELLRAMHRQAGLLWEGRDRITGEHQPKDCVQYALERLLAIELEKGDSQQAVALLLDAAKLPFTDEERLAYRVRAAATLTEAGRLAEATVLYQEFVRKAPSDEAMLATLAELLERQRRVSELLAARRRQLELTRDSEQRLALRLEIAQLIAEVENEDGRVRALKGNLAERPGHPSSIDELCTLLQDRNRLVELSDLLADQAAQLQSQEMNDPAAALWMRAAELAESKMKDFDRALLAYRKVADLSDDPIALSALAKLHLKRSEPGEAASWFKRRLQHAEDQERVALQLQLARALLKAQRNDEAIQALRAAFDEAPRNAEVRRLLFDQYRSRGEWEPLAETLARAASAVNDAATVLSYAREAAQIYRDRLGSQERAVEVLQHARPHAPDDRELGVMLAEGLVAAGSHDDATALIEELLEAFGLRRSAQRAHVHDLLAKSLAARGEIQGALDQLEIAHKMDNDNVEIVRMMSELAREAGELERAERGYRALLMIVRQAAEQGGQATAIGVGEVLVELCCVAEELKQSDQASERFESALEVLVGDPADARRAQEVLLKRGQMERLQRLLDERLRHDTDPVLRASVLDEYASLLQGPLAQPELALERRLESIECRPADPELHDRAQALAAELEQAQRYVELLDELLGRAKSPAQRYVRCELLLRLGGVAEQSGELETAADFYMRAEQTGVREVDVWRAQAACAGARGDKEEQMRILGALAEMGERQVETKARADALYRLAEVQLSSEHTVPDGVSSLTRALDDDPRYERAARILRRACRTEAIAGDLLALYERVARASSDERLLLSYLELQAARPDALPEEVREGADLALRLEEHETAERLMLRAVELSQDLPDGNARVCWALLAVSDRRLSVGDLAGAVKWLLSAVEVAEPAELLPRVHALGQAALAPGGDLILGAKLCERVLSADPTAREAWEPLAAIYARRGDRERLEQLVDETLDSLDAAGDRNILRMNYASLLMERGGDEAQQAIEVLREVLIEDASHRVAQEQLAQMIEHHGTAEEVLDMLREQLRAAQNRRDAEAVRNTSLQLGMRLSHGSQEDAAAVYRDALTLAPGDPELLARLLECVEPDGSECMQVLERLAGVAEGQAAAEYALRAMQLYEAASDPHGALRVLELAAARAPEALPLQEELEQRYRATDNFAGIARLLGEKAEREQDTAKRVSLLCELARVQRTGLGDSMAAVATLEQGRQLSPQDEGLTLELAETQVAAEQPARALEMLDECLQRGTSQRRAELLRVRARACAALSDHHRALSDLEEALELSGDDAVAAEMERAFEVARTAAADQGDLDAVRALTMRWVQTALSRGASDRAAELLSRWLAERADDLDAMEQLMDLRHKQGDHDGVAELCAQAIRWSQGAQQVAFAVRMAEASERAGNPQAAREELEHAYAQAQDSVELRTHLSRIYELSGAHVELGVLLLDDAAACDNDESKVPLLKQAGESFLRAGEAERALAPLHEALALDSSNFDLLIEVVQACIQAERIDEANSLLDQGLEDPQCKRGRRAILSQRKAWLARALGDQQVELSWLEEAFKHDRSNGQIALELADLAEGLEQWETADQALRGIALIKKDPPISRGEAFLRQSRNWLQRGDHKRALAWARKAKQEEPESEQVEAMLQHLGTQ